MSFESIEAIEAKGQKDLVQKRNLPKDMRDGGKAIPILEKWGIKILKEVKDDPLFVECQFPEDWKLEAKSDTNFWSYLIDDKGRKRAEVFYKAAFYDKEAHLIPLTYYDINTNEKEKGKRYLINTKDGKVLHETDNFEEGRDWLNSNYSDWQNPLAYWDEN